MHFVEIILSLSGYMLNVMYTATNEPAQTTKQFEIRTAQGLARFLACTKCFRDGFYRNGRTGHWVSMKDFKFPIAGAHCKIQKGCPPKIWKISELQNVRQSKTNPFERVLSCAYLEKKLSVDQLSRTLLGCRRAWFKSVFRVRKFGRVRRYADRISLSAEVVIVDQIGHCDQPVYYCNVCNM